VGAIIILIILFSLSIFFVKTKTEAMKSNPKISFLETTQQYTASENAISKLESAHSPEKEELTIEHNSSKKKGFTVQLGIFSDEINMKRVKDQVNSMGYKTNTQAVKINDEVKIRLTTNFFQTKNRHV
jgi:cell division septation protein DedD